MEQLERIKVEYKSPAWYKLREDAIGCSEIGILLGSIDWSSPVTIFYSKIGLHRDVFESNERMFHGTNLEPYILDLWRYWDGKDYFKNKQEGKVIRELTDVKDTVYRRRDIPFILYTPDGEIPAGSKTLFGDTLDKPAPLEAKMIDSLLFHIYNSDLPETYKNQVHGEMIVMDSDYSEVAALVGGNNFNVFPIVYDKNMGDLIIEVCYKFWYKHVVPAKALVAEYREATTDKDRNLIEYEIARLEPPPDSTEAYKKFMSARFAGSDRRLLASDAVSRLMKQREAIKSIKNYLDNKQKLISNLLLNLHVKEQAMYIEDEEGNKSSFNKRHSVTVRSKPSEEWVKSQIRKLNISSYE